MIFWDPPSVISAVSQMKSWTVIILLIVLLIVLDLPDYKKWNLSYDDVTMPSLLKTMGKFEPPQNRTNISLYHYII